MLLVAHLLTSKLLNDAHPLLPGNLGWGLMENESGLLAAEGGGQRNLLKVRLFSPPRCHEVAPGLGLQRALPAAAPPVAPPSWLSLAQQSFARGAACGCCHPRGDSCSNASAQGSAHALAGSDHFRPSGLLFLAAFGSLLG